MSESWFNMPKLLFIILVFAFTSLDGNAQENTTDTLKTEDILPLLSQSQKSLSQINNVLRARLMLLKLKIYPLINLNKDQYGYYSELIDTIQNLDNVEVADSIIITLKSGLSWNMGAGPPSAPKHFYKKAFSKKGREDKTVMDRIKYLQFCHSLSEPGIEMEDMIEKFNTYNSIFIDGVKYYQMYFEFKFNEEGRMKVTNREIYIKDFFSHNQPDEADSVQTNMNLTE